MKKTSKALFLCLIIIMALLTFIAVNYFSKVNMAVLNPKGIIASKERNLMFLVFGLSLMVIGPVFGFLIFITIKYHESNTRAKYRPELDHSRLLETVWWLLPALLILYLSFVTWHSSHSLAPQVPIASKKMTMTIEVVALDWKWLFIYPKQDIATVNYAEIPINQPIDFQITSAAPMNSFWVPQLGGQIYAMAGMVTHLNLMATAYGNFNGSSANISGKGFSSMHFIVRSVGNNNFNSWLNRVKMQRESLSIFSYNKLALPAIAKHPLFYSSYSPHLFSDIVMSYMMSNNKLHFTTSTLSSMTYNKHANLMNKNDPILRGHKAI